MTNKLDFISEEEIALMIEDTSKIVTQRNINILENAVIASSNSNSLANEVEFWKWLDRNFEKSAIFESTTSLQKYIQTGNSKQVNNLKLELQGKGYEWDWMTQQRTEINNLFKHYYAGDKVNRPGSDVTETNVLTGSKTEYQMKAYTSEGSLHLYNTDKSNIVVTNKEKVQNAERKGYKTETFQDNEIISANRDARYQNAEKGNVRMSYNLKNITTTMAKSGAIGCVIGIGTEAIASYKAWKNKLLTDDEYLKEIMKSGGDAGVTSGATAGIMVPVSATITTAGVSTLITIPIAFVVAGTVNKFVAPCFGRGKYREILNEAKYYQRMEDFYDHFLSVLGDSMNQYDDYVNQMIKQEKQFEQTKFVSKDIDQKLIDLFDQI